MGYTTDFEGRFSLYRPEGPEQKIFLADIQAGDLAALGPLADWLTNQGDPRGPRIGALGRDPAGLAEFWPLFGLRPEHAAYLMKFSETRRMLRDPDKAAALPDPVRAAVGLPVGPGAGYFVGGGGFCGQDRDDSVRDYNRPPPGQPGLWCQWVTSEDRAGLEWNGAEKFYHYAEWLQYLLDHFLTPWGYVVFGDVTWQGEEDDDTGRLRVSEGRVSAEVG